MKKFLIAILFLFAFSFAVSAQTVGDTVCIGQETANKLYDLANKGKNFDALKEADEKAIAERDKIIEDLKIKLAMESQRGSDKDAEIVRLTAIIEFLLKHGRVKKYGIINF